jgi:isocitrate/isopropylmalate dehydrogenase
MPPRCGKPVDLVVVRENTEGFYADRNMFMGSGEFMPTPDVALAVRKITRTGSTRIAETAFKLAMQRPRKKVTAVHKANVLRITDGLFLECVRAVQKNYPQVEYEEQIMDAMAALLVRDASRFDVILGHQRVRRYSVRRSLGDFRQPRSRRLDQCRQRARAGPGPARLGARHRRQGRRLIRPR